MNENILKIQEKIFKSAKYDLLKNKWKLKEKKIYKLQDEVRDYVENNFYYNTEEQVSYIVHLITIGLLEEIIRELNE